MQLDEFNAMAPSDAAAAVRPCAAIDSWVQAVVDGVGWVLDESVGVEDHGGSWRQGVGVVGPVLFVSIGMGSIIALKAFAATIIGGFGDVKGAIVGGLFIGVVESFAAYYISVPYKDAYAFLMLFLVLVFRPQGFFGEKVSEKA